jgi:hypothetical protein
MHHPLVDQLDDLTITEIENKIVELQRKYFQSNNPQVQTQISLILDIYKEEGRARRAKEFLQQQNNNNESGEEGLDNLINIS